MHRIILLQGSSDRHYGFGTAGLSILLEFRLKNLKDEKMIDCLKAVAEKFGYKPGKTPGGRGIGVAVGTDAGTWGCAYG